jgi:Bacterial protein of unknown function (DUF894).
MLYNPDKLDKHFASEKVYSLSLFTRGGRQIVMISEGIFAPIKSRSFRALWIGQSLSRLGDSVLSVMLSIIVLSITGSTVKMGIVMTLLMIPQIVLLPFTGLLVDRVARVPIMIVADFIRFILLSGLTFISVYSSLNINYIYAYAFISGTMSALFQPAYSAVRAQVFTIDIRNAANSLTQITEQFARLIGPFLGGLIGSLASYGVGLGIDAVSFLISAVSLLFLKVEKPAARKEEEGGLKKFTYDLMGGYRELRKHEWLWDTILIFALVNTASAGFTPILLPWLVKANLHMSDYAYGLLISAYGIGSLICALFFGLRAKWKRRGIMAYAGVGITGLVMCVIAVANYLPVLVLLMVLGGAGIMLFSLIWEGSLQELVPPESYGRVSSLDMLGSWALMPVGYMISGWMAQQFGTVNTTVIEGGIMAVVVFVAMYSIKCIRDFD